MAKKRTTKRAVQAWTVRMPKGLKSDLDAWASDLGMSRQELVVRVLSQAVQLRQGQDPAATGLFGGHLDRIVEEAVERAMASAWPTSGRPKGE